VILENGAEIVPPPEPGKDVRSPLAITTRQRRILTLVSALLFAAGLANYRPWRGFSSDRRVEFNAEPIRIAHNLRETGNFANPFSPLPTGPTAHIAPGFPALQFLLMETFGDGAAGWLALQTLPVVALCLELAVLPWFARGIGLSFWTGALAAVFGLLNKPGSEPQWEAHLAGLLGLFLCAVVCRFELNRQSLVLALGTGVLSGALFYFQPVFALPYVCWVISFLRRGHFTRSVLIISLVPAALCLPWSLRNYWTLGTPEIRDNFGLELYVSFNDCAPYGLKENLASLCHGAHHPNSSVEEAADVKRLGEFNYNRARFRRACGWILAHPAVALALIAKRFWFFWFPSDGGLSGYRLERARLLYQHIFTILAICGLYWSWKRYCLRFVHLCFLLFPMVYYVVEFDPRYRYPILWMTWLLAAYATLELFARCRRS
jgi:hypothetical protein